MKFEIIELKILNAQDLITAQRTARRVTEMMGIQEPQCTKLSTVVSEAARLIYSKGQKGTAKFWVFDSSTKPWLSVTFLLAEGEELPNPRTLERGLQPFNALASEIIIHSENGQFMHCEIRQRVDPPQRLDSSVVATMVKAIEEQTPVSPYEEIKKQNLQLLDALSKLKEEQAKSNRLNDLLAEKNEELQGFARVVSHDLKNPLQVFQLALDQITDYVEENEVSERLLSIMDSKVKSMFRMIDDILTYSRAGMDELPKEDVNVEALVDEVVEGISRPDGMEIKVDNSLPQIHTERIYLQQIFSNLISNAVKYHNRDDGWIKVYHRPEGKGWKFFVEDNGPGIKTEKQGSVFNLFENFGKGQGLGSSGVGLSIVKRLVENRGGQIELISDGENGSTFAFTWE